MAKSKSVRLPKKIKLQDQDIVIRSRSKFWGKRNKAMGMYTNCDKSRHKIEWDRSQPKEEVVNTIIHELLHAIYAQAKIKRRSEEEVVRKMADGIESALKSNPNLLDWLYKKLK